MGKDLKDCECGSEAVIESFSDCIVIKCDSDCCYVNETVTCDTEEDAVQEWNELME